MKNHNFDFYVYKNDGLSIVLRHDQIYSRVNNVKSCLDTHLRDPEASAELSPSQYCKQNTLFGARNHFCNLSTLYISVILTMILIT